MPVVWRRRNAVLPQAGVSCVYLSMWTLQSDSAEACICSVTWAMWQDSAIGLDPNIGPPLEGCEDHLRARLHVRVDVGGMLLLAEKGHGVSHWLTGKLCLDVCHDPTLSDWSAFLEHRKAVTRLAWVYFGALSV